MSELLNNVVRKESWISSGSTLVNLAASGTLNGCYTTGRYFWICGDSSAGKTMLTMTALAEASINPEFDDYDLIFDNAEDGALMDVEKFFGPKLAKRLTAPEYDSDGDPIYSSSVEGFYFWLAERLELVKKGKKKKFICLLDSMDALTTKYEGDKFEEKRAADRSTRAGKKVQAKGDYGDGKAKINSTYLRRVVADLRDTGCTLIILSQTRDNIDAGMFDAPTVTAGGHALKFYATFQMWLTPSGKLKKTINGVDWQIGITSRISIKKNRLTGKEWSVKVPIYHSVGIDDIGSCVDFLVEQKHWSADQGKIVAKELDFSGKREALIAHIQDNSLELDFREVVLDVWKSIEEGCVVERKNKYQ